MKRELIATLGRLNSRPASSGDALLELYVAISPEVVRKGELGPLVGLAVRAKGSPFSQQLLHLSPDERQELRNAIVQGGIHWPASDDPVLSRLSYELLRIHEPSCPALRAVAEATRAFRPRVAPALNPFVGHNPQGPQFFLRTWESTASLEVHLNVEHSDADWLGSALDELSTCVDREVVRSAAQQAP